MPTLPRPGTELDPGEYSSSVGNLGVMFEVGPGWTYEQSAPGFFDIEQDPGSPDVIAVQFASVGDIRRSSRTVLEDIGAQPDLVVSDQEEVEIGCMGMTRITVQTTDPADTDPPIFKPVVTIEAGPLSIASGRRLQLNVFDIHMGTAMILIGGSIKDWDRTLATVQPVMDSVQLAPSGGGVFPCQQP